MTTKNGRTDKLQSLVKERLGLAQAQLKELVERGKAQGKELQAWAGKFGAEDLKRLESQARVELTRRAGEARKQLSELQNRALGLVGAASQNQIKQLKTEVTRLAKKVDQFAGRRGGDA